MILLKISCFCSTYLSHLDFFILLMIIFVFTSLYHRWNDKVHGTQEIYWIWVEDPNSNNMYHSEQFALTKKQVGLGLLSLFSIISGSEGCHCYTLIIHYIFSLFIILIRGERYIFIAFRRLCRCYIAILMCHTVTSS